MRPALAGNDEPRDGCRTQPVPADDWRSGVTRANRENQVGQCYGRRYDVAMKLPSPLVATQAIQTALTAIVHPGDEVIVLEPKYEAEPVILVEWRCRARLGS